MTPEDRAQKAVQHAWVTTTERHELAKHVTQAIREAVEEEREAIAKWHEEQAERHARKARHSLDGFARGAETAHEQSATAVRYRGTG